jgi:hypothetical protein
MISPLDFKAFEKRRYQFPGDKKQHEPSLGYLKPSANQSRQWKIPPFSRKQIVLDFRIETLDSSVKNLGFSSKTMGFSSENSQFFPVKHSKTVKP